MCFSCQNETSEYKTLKCKNYIIGHWTSSVSGAKFSIRFNENGLAFFDYTQLGGKKFVEKYDINDCEIKTKIYPYGLRVVKLGGDTICFKKIQKKYEKDIDVIYETKFYRDTGNVSD